MEWCSKSHPRKKFKRGIEDGKSLLHLFIEYFWDERDGELSGSEEVELLNWLKPQNLNLDKELWFLSSKLDVRIASRTELREIINAEDNRQQQIRDFNSKRSCAKIVYNMRKVLPFLIQCNDNVKYTDEDGRNLLHFLLEGYLKITERFTQEDLGKMHNLIKKLMTRGATLYAPDKSGKSPFHVAELCENKKILEVIISCLADVNAYGNTTLHVIADNCLNEKKLEHKNEYMDILRTFALKGTDMNVKNIEGLTPVHFAAKKFHTEMLRFFADSGADFQQRTHADESPLHCACKSLVKLNDISKMIETIEFLVNQGCEIEAVDKKGYMPLHYAAQFGSVEVVQRLIELGANVDCQTKLFLITPLYLAATKDRLDVMKKLVEMGADVNFEIADGGTPIFMSALLGSLESMNFLFIQGADLHHRNKIQGFTLLHLAASCVNLKQLPIDDRSKTDKDLTISYQEENKLNFLIKKQLDVNDPATSGLTPLQMAVVVSGIEAVKTLIKHGANVNFQSDKSELSAVHIAAMKGHLEITETLIQAGADVNCRGGPDRSTPLHLVLIKVTSWHLGNIDNAKASFRELSSIDDVWPVHRTFFESLPHELTMTLIKNGADVNAKDSFGRSPLYLATFWSHRSSSKILLESGAHVNIQDNEGNLPLSNALKNNQLYILEALLSFGADINDEDISQQIVHSEGDLKDVAIEHALKLKLLELPVPSIYEPSMKDPELADFYVECLNEVNTLKNYYIDNISLYHFLSMNIKRQYYFVEKVSSLFESLKKLFPLYFGIIRGTCREATHRNSLLESAAIALIQISNFPWPDICADRILSFMSNRYLDALTECVKPNERISIKGKWPVMNGWIES